MENHPIASIFLMNGKSATSKKRANTTKIQHNVNLTQGNTITELNKLVRYYAESDSDSMNTKQHYFGVLQSGKIDFMISNFMQ